MTPQQLAAKLEESFNGHMLHIDLDRQQIEMICAALRAPRPEVAPTFEQVRDAIVTRMGGHTFSLRDAPAVENFMALLAMVKREECSLPSPLAANFKEKP